MPVHTGAVAPEAALLLAAHALDRADGAAAA
jgi:hypothetical protein